MTEYEKFQQIMREINFRKQMKENRKRFGVNYDLPPGFEKIFNQFKYE